MFSKGNKLFSIFASKCPRCHEGEVFKEKNPYKLRHIFNMHVQCSVCGQRYEIERGFFYGSMYVNYALAIALSVAVFVALEVLYPVGFKVYLIVNASLLFLLTPFVARIGRLIWMNLFIHYSKHPSGNEDKKLP
jgi:uncharacterized protein (DUF983 family)